jgi:simple sugar transport system ATP-binding protein
MSGNETSSIRSSPAQNGDGRARSGPPVAEAIDITKRYGSTVALDQARIRVLQGETHALVGRNGAGKSTLVSILTGLQAPDTGRVLFAGAAAPRRSDRDAWRRHVACVFQKSTIIAQLTVAENLLLNRYDRGRGGLISWRALRQRARDLLAVWSVEVDVDAKAKDLSVEQRQFVEIARALSFGARFIILDEPTAQLDAGAIARLFDHIRDLQAQGVTFLFISHHLQEIYEICDVVTVFRDARQIVTAPVADLPRGELVAAMTGEATALDVPRSRTAPTGEVAAVLDVAGLRLDGVFEDVTFEVGAGEIVGLAGAGGSGRTEVAETIVGLRAPDAGTITVDGRTPRAGNVGAALTCGVGFVPQDRHHQGLVAGMSIADNATMTIPERLGTAGFLSTRRRDVIAGTLIEALAIKTAGPDLPVAGLSGGNQQKVVMARALANDPKVLVLITPTAGVDVRSKEFLLDKVDQVAAAGTGVIVASDELDDLRICDRVLVMFKGGIVAEMASGWRDHDLVAAMEGLTVDA